MPDDTVQDLLANPDFQKLSPAAQTIVISKRFPEFSKLSPDAQKIVLSKSAPKVEAPPPQAPGVAPTGDTLNDIFSATHELAPLPSEASAAGNLPMIGAMAATGGLGPEAGALVRLAAGVGGAGAGSVGKQVLQGRTPSVGETALDATVQGAVPEVAGSTLSAVGNKLAPAASQSLARILRLPAKAFMFNREPAQEVLERGLASGSLETTRNAIGEASKQVTSQLETTLKNTNGTVDIFGPASDISKSLPSPAVANRFEQVILDAADKLGLKNLDRLTPLETNQLKQEVAKQARFVEGDMRPSVANAARQFGGKLKDSLVGLNADVAPLLESSANLTEASKGADFAVRSEKRGLTKGLISGFEVNKPGSYLRPITDRPSGAQTMFRVAQTLKNAGVGISTALRIALGMTYPQGTEE